MCSRLDVYAYACDRRECVARCGVVFLFLVSVFTAPRADECCCVCVLPAHMALRNLAARVASRAIRPRPLLAPQNARPFSAATPGTVDEESYHILVDRTLEGVQDVYDEIADDFPELELEVEYSSGVLNVVVGTLGTFVLNKQAPNMQLWLSSPITGPLRYNYCQATASWLNSRDDHRLFDRLADDFETLSGKRPDFSAVAEELATQRQ